MTAPRPATSKATRPRRSRPGSASWPTTHSRTAIADPSRIRLAACAIALAAAVAAGGCGDSGTEEPDEANAPAAEPVGQELGGSVASLTECRDWAEATPPQKLATIEAIRAQLNRGDAAVDAPPLSDDEAMDVFDGACSESFAASFRLYVLYARAAGFASLTR